MERISTDICIIGAGSGGLSVAAGAAQMGAKVVLIEGAAMGGDCLNFGCVPSKALLAAGRVAQTVRTGTPGVAGAAPQIDFAAVKAQVAAVIAQIAPVDSQERFEGFGVQVIRAYARFVSPREVEAGGKIIRARRFVIATGSHPMIPELPGLETVPYLTNETIFAQSEQPDASADPGRWADCDGNGTGASPFGLCGDGDRAQQGAWARRSRSRGACAGHAARRGRVRAGGARHRPPAPASRRLGGRAGRRHHAWQGHIC